MTVQDFTSELQYTIWHYMQNNHCHRVTAHMLSNILYIYYYIYMMLCLFIETWNIKTCMPDRGLLAIFETISSA